MKNYKNNLNRKGVWLFICVLLLTSSCGAGTVAVVKPNQNFKPSEDMSIVFGRLEIFKDGQLIPADATSIPMFSGGFFSFSTNSIQIADVSSFPEKKWSVIRLGLRKNFIIRTEQSDRYFIAALPPGKYHIFCYNNEHAVFDVAPKSKTYIGTIRINIDSVRIERAKEKSISIPPIGGGIGAAAGQFAGELVKEGIHLLFFHELSKVKKVEIVNENEKAKEFFHTFYPNFDFTTNTVEKLVELIPCSFAETK